MSIDRRIDSIVAPLDDTITLGARYHRSYRRTPKEREIKKVHSAILLDPSTLAFHSLASRWMDRIHRVLDAQAVRISRRLKTQV